MTLPARTHQFIRGGGRWSLLQAFGIAWIFLIVHLFGTASSRLYLQLEIETPPSAYGLPVVVMSQGDTHTIIYSNRLESQPEPVFHHTLRFPLLQGTGDTLHIYSFQPAGQIGRMKARLYTPDHVLLQSWEGDAFRPMTLEEACEAATLYKPLTAESLRSASSWKPPALGRDIAEPIVNGRFWLVGLIIFLASFLFLQGTERHAEKIRSIYARLVRQLLLPGKYSPLRLWFGCFLAVSFVTLGVGKYGGFYYMTADDPIMSLTAQGYLTGRPDYHLVFIHPLIGLLLQTLFTVSGTFPWYPALMISLTVTGMSTVFFVILERARMLLHGLGVLVILCTLGLYLIIYIQFTMVSFIAGLAGLFLFLSGSRTEGLSRVRLAVALGFLLVSAALRLDPPLLLLALFLPLLFWLGRKGMLPRWRSFLLGLMALFLLLAATETAAYHFSPGWREFSTYNHLRGALFDTPLTQDYKDNPEVYQAIGWSRNDLGMFKSLCIQQPDIFSAPKLAFLLDHLRLPRETSLFWACAATLSRNSPIILLWLMAMAAGWMGRLTSRSCFFLIVIPHIIFVVYLIKTARLPERVLSPLFFTQFCLFLFYYRFPENIARVRALACALLVFVPLQGFVLKSLWEHLFQGVELNRQRSYYTSQSMAELPRGSSYIIINTIIGAALEETPPLGNFSEARGLKILELDWSFPSPIYRQKIEALQLTDPFLDLASRRDVYLAVSVWDLKKVVYIQRFLEEHHGLRVHCEIARLPGMDRDAVFPFFSLFRLRSDTEILSQP